MEKERLLHQSPPTSPKHPRMSRMARAAQFAPFAALVGYEDCLAERRRTTEDFCELDAVEIAEINRTLTYLAAHPELKFSLTFFVPDDRKTGGEYRKTVGYLKRIDELEGTLILTDNKKIPIEKITKIEVYENESTQ